MQEAQYEEVETDIIISQYDKWEHKRRNMNIKK